MYSLDYSVTSWGSPAAPKRALLLHGMMGTGGVFFKVADILIKHGYRVDCPDLLGHGWAPHAPSSDRYTISLLASHLAKHLSQEKYGIIGGVSWGCPVILALLPQLQHPPPRVVLVEPILDLAPLPQARIDGMLASTKTPPTEEALLKDNPDWSQEEAVLKRLAFMQMDPRAITDLFEELKSGNVPHSLIPSSSALGSTELIILAGDPALHGVYPPSNADILGKDYPHVKFGWKKGATHNTHKTDADVVAAVILDGMKGQMGIEVLRP